MRINKFIASATGLSRRAADQAITGGRVTINDGTAQIGANANEQDVVMLDGKRLQATTTTTIIFNKPVGYVVSRHGQGSQTIYDLLPEKLHTLKPVGRLDKDSSGLLLLTNDGQLANELTHPRYAKEKMYEVALNKPLTKPDRAKTEAGVQLGDGPSKLALQPLGETGKRWQVAMSEGRNRQIRRTFAKLGYTVTLLHRTRFGSYELGELKEAAWAGVAEK